MRSSVLGLFFATLLGLAAGCDDPKVQIPSKPVPLPTGKPAGELSPAAPAPAKPARTNRESTR